MKTEKLVLNLPGNELFLGSHFHQLEDHTQTTFRATNMISFVGFLKARETQDYRVLCTPTSVTAWPTKIDRYSQPIALLNLSRSSALNDLAAIARKKKTLAEFAEFLEKFKQFGSGDALLALLSNLRQFRFKKVLTCESNDDRKGNFSFKISLEKGGNDDFTPPDTLTFKVPIFKFHPDIFQHQFQLLFEAKPSETVVELGFTIESFTFEEDLEEAQISAIKAGLEGIPTEFQLWGTHDVKVLDDSWRFKANPTEVIR